MVIDTEAINNDINKLFKKIQLFILQNVKKHIIFINCLLF